MAKKIIENQQTHFLDIITPSGLKFNGDSFQIGDLWAKVIVVTDYPPRLSGGWLSKLANLPGITCSIHVTPTDSFELIQSINRSVGELLGKIDAGGSALTQKRNEQQYKDALSLMDKIDKEQQNIVYMMVMFMVTASEKGDLLIKSKRLESTLAGASMRGRGVFQKQQEGLWSVAPFGLAYQDIKNHGNRNVPIETVAYSFPFNNLSINDGYGVPIGRDANGGFCLLDIWSRGNKFQDRANSNWMIMGKPGMGKTLFYQKLQLFLWSTGAKIILIDPEDENKNFVKNIGGDYINAGGGSKGIINPLQIRGEESSDEQDEEEDNFSTKNPLTIHMQFLRTFLKLYLGDSLDAKQYQYLFIALEDFYKSWGLDFDTSIHKIRSMNNSDFPHMGDLYNYLTQKAETEPEKFEHAALFIRSAGVGSDSFLWANHTSIETNSNFINFNIKTLQEADENLQKAQYFNILSYIWNDISSNRDRSDNKKIVLGVDEAHLLIDPQNPMTLKFLKAVSKRIRKYNGSLMVISHSPVDFLSPQIEFHGSALLNNPTFRIFFGCGENDIQSLQKLYRLTEAEEMILLKSKVGHALLLAGNKRVAVNIEVFPFENEIIRQRKA